LIAGLSGGETVQFAIATACLKHATPGDFGLATPEDVDAFRRGRFDVQR
jgi:hypothetical protein